MHYQQYPAIGVRKGVALSLMEEMYISIRMPPVRVGGTGREEGSRMGHEAPAQQKAIAFLGRLCDRLRASGARRLPPLRELSRSQGIAYVSMVKAVRRLCREGVLRSVQGSGTFLREGPAVLAGPPEPGGPPAPARTWRRVAEELRGQLLRGEYDAGSPLPSSKHLLRTYGVSYPTVRKALEQLRGEGLVQPFGHGYRVRGLGSQAGRGTVVVLARGAHDLNRLSVRAQELYRAAQGECARARTGIHLAFYDYNRAGRLTLPAEDRAMLREPHRHGLLGFFLFERGFPAGSARVAARAAAHTGLPVAVLVETGACAPGEFGRIGHLTREFSISCLSLCGTVVARFLLGCGHQRIAYICPSHRTTWSQNRLAGIRRTFAEAGLGDGVVAFTADHRAPVGTPAAQFDDAGAAVGRILGAAADRQDRYGQLLARALPGLTQRISDAVSREALGGDLRPLLEAAVAERSVSAWVGSNDDVAVQCLRFLGGRGIAVPGELSVVGFDDTLEAFIRDLTSYNHNMTAVVRAMLSHVLQPRARAATQVARQSTEVEGFVTVRRTTAGRMKS